MNTHTTSFWKWSLATAVAAALAPLAGCADTEPPKEGDGEFISDSPFGGPNFGGDNEGSGGGTSTNTGTQEPSDDPEKAIVEADIIQVDGDHLFALSQYGGLTVVDMANPAQLSILGHYRVQGIPFEMYLQDGIVYAMFSSFGQWICDATYESCEYVSSSHIEALDVSNPADIVKIGSFDLPGEISDSRIVGEVLYAVSYENGYCWNCDTAPRTVVTSINVASPDDIHVVDAVSFTSDDIYGYGWWRRSVSVTQDRMFVAGIEWNGEGAGHSTIQVVDISDPAGALHLGAEVQAAGQIESRWQMDEKDGFLRVISQPGVWENGVPTVQTFQVASSDSVVPIASLDLVLPKPERLRSARFDGDRLFAITAEQTDPLFTIDVTDPAQPTQLGELEIPGWIYHLEPRGDRLFALGFDNANPDGSMNVSLFDVADLTAPTLLKRVAFGGDWSWAPEDQDRIHKAFKIDSDLGAIFVPYGAYSYDETAGYYGCAEIESGIQIVDFTQDTLTKRGMAPLNGFARRALIHEGKLFSVSDSEVGAYDIADRDSPARIDQIGLSAWVNQSLRVGDKIVRVSADWWTSAAKLDVVPANDPGRIEPIGALDLKEIVQGGDDASCYGWGYFYGAQLFELDASRVAITWSSYDWYYEGDGTGSENQTHVVVVNISNPAGPSVEGQISMPFTVDMWGYYGSIDGGKAVVQMGDRLVFRRITRSQSESDLEQASLEVVDLSNPGAPDHSASIPLPSGNGHSLLVKNANTVLTSHWEPVGDSSTKVKFYLDRVVFSSSGTAIPAPSINVPGALLSFDAASSHALTIDFHRVNLPGVSSQDCYENHGGAWYDDSMGVAVCSYMEQSLNLISLAGNQVDVLDSEELDASFYVYSTQVTETRVFVQGYSYDLATNAGAYTVRAIGDIGANQIQMADEVMPQSMWAVAAEDEYVVLASYDTPGIHVLDASDLGDLTVTKKADVSSYVYAVTLDGDRALCAMGPYGLESVDLN